MNRIEVMEKLIKILKKSNYYFLQEVLNSITEKSSLNEELSMDSIQIMEFLIDIEDEFQIRFDFNEFNAASIECIGAIIDEILSYLKKDNIS